MTTTASALNGTYTSPKAASSTTIHPLPSHTTTTSPASTTPLTQAALSFLAAFSTLSPSDVVSHCTPEFTHSVSPDSLSLPSRGREDFKTHSGRVFSLFSTWNIVPQTIFEDAAKSTVVLHVKMGGKVKGEALGGLQAWENEAVMWVELSKTEVGDGASRWMVKAFREFVDSKLAEKLRAILSGTVKQGTLEE